MNVYKKIEEYLSEANLPKGSKKINSKLAYVKDEHGITVWEFSNGKWTEWWTMDAAQFKREFGKIA